jgi:phosphatidylglycerophosphate synthase
VAMQLHHASAEPDWAAIAPEKRNYWQRVAAQTRGVVTPGNVTSVVGVSFVALGLWYIGRGRLWSGLVTVGIGRLLDIADGALAERTGTKSPLGESVDATLDKLVVFAALIVFAVAGILPAPVALLVGFENAVTAVLSLAAKSLRRRIQPVRAGKLGTAVEWGALLFFVLGAAVLAIVSIGMNGYATIRYAQAFRAQRQREQRTR